MRHGGNDTDPVKRANIDEDAINEGARILRSGGRMIVNMALAKPRTETQSVELLRATLAGPIAYGNLLSMVSVLLPNKNLLFIHVPKTGGGSISRALRAEPDAVALPVKAMAKAEPCLAQLQRQLPQSLASYQTVAFVRNPWDWVVSGYLHVTRNLPAYDDPPSFRDFVMGNWRGATQTQYPTKFMSPLAFVAYHTQITPWEHLVCDDGNVRIDSLCTFEALESHAAEIFELSGLEHVNRSIRSHYSVYYDEETRAAVALRHAPLIERMGYRFESE